MLTIASYGGGKNSKWAIANWVSGGAALDLVLFADTGRRNAEKPETYADVDRFFDWLRGRGIQAEVVRVSGETLEENCLRRQQLPAIAYGFKTCSLRWKLEPQEKFVNNWPVARAAWERGEKIQRIVGYHAGESWRAKPFEDSKYFNRYPLIEWGHDNEDCAKGLISIGLCVPPKSSCFFCPNMREWEVLELRDRHPELLGRALEMERTAKPNLITIKGLARDISWRQILDYDKDQLKLLSRRARPVPCGCSDGEDE